MKYSNKLKLVATSIITSAILVGCSASNDDASYVTNSGVAIDPELQGATVFLDINENGTLDTGEPSTTTDDLGNYFLRIQTTQVGAPIVVTGGIDLVTREEFTGQLSVISEDENTNLHITPLTTLVHQYKKANPSEDIDAIKTQLAIQLDINSSDLDANIVEEGNEALLQIALRVQKMAQGIVDSNSTNTTIEAVYSDIATELETKGLDTALIDACDKNIDDTDFENAKLKDLDHELLLLTGTLTAEQLALSMDNIENNVTAATTQLELDDDIYDNADMIISDESEVQLQRRERTFAALGLTDLDDATKALIYNDASIDFEDDSLDDILERMMEDDMVVQFSETQTLMFQEMLTHFEDYEGEMTDDDMMDETNNDGDDDNTTDYDASTDSNTTL